MKRSSHALLGLVLLLGCNAKEPSTAADLGPTMDAEPDAAPKLAIERPQLADWPCHDGWEPEKVAKGSEVEHAICVPPKQLTCPPGQAQFLGEQQCGPIGTSCPTGAFLEEAEIRSLAPGFEGNIFYVAAGPVGDGSRDKPLPTIDHALAVANAGDVIALANEEYLVEGVMLRHRIALVGACVSGTKLLSVIEAPLLAVVTVTGTGGARVANLSTGGPRLGVVILEGQPEQPASLWGLEVDGAVGLGVALVSPSVSTLSRVVIRDTQDIVSDAPGTAFMGGQGLYVEASTTVQQALLQGNLGRAIDMVNSTETIACQLHDLIVRDTAPGADMDMAGRGLVVGQGTQLELRRALIEGSHEAGLMLAHSPGTEPPQVEAEDLIVRDTRSRAWDKKGGVGISVVDGAQLTAQRVLLERNRFVGLMAEGVSGGKAPSVKISDLVIRDTLADDAANARGFALAAQAGVQLTIERGVFERNREAAIFVNETAPELYGSPSATLSDIYVAETLSSEATATGGMAIVVQHGSTMTLNRVLLDGNRSAAILASADDGRTPPKATISHATIRNTKQAACAELAPTDPRRCVFGETMAGGGSGIGVRKGSLIVLKLFNISHSVSSALVIGQGGLIEATQGEIHHNTIGLNVQDASFDAEAVTNATVRFYENEANVSTAKLALPKIPDF